MPSRKNSRADICLVLEGTYPYVSGGVSTWVHQILHAFPQWQFAVFYLGAEKTPDLKPRYELPPNLVHLEEVFLFQPSSRLVRLRDSVPASWEPLYENLRKLFVRTPNGDAHDFMLVGKVLQHIASHSAVDFDTFWRDAKTWAVLREVYDRYAPDDSFIDFFWACRFLIAPVWKLGRSLARMPRARLYHTACTGYAGLAAALASAANDTPLLLSEHGIYLRERITDICRSPWIPDNTTLHTPPADPLGTLRLLWIGFFDVIGRLCYHRAEAIASLFEKNAAAQRHFGAEPGRIRIIPNGIRTEECDGWHEQRRERREKDPESAVIGFLGRVVSIKDVKTLLRTARKVCDRLPQARFLIGGPGDEEPEYFEECIALAGQLGLQKQVEFLGATQRAVFLPQIDIMILTSVSEGLPFVVLEALATGIPVVSTDVGACAEILRGRPESDAPALECGLIAEIGDADQLAAACVRLLTDRPLLEAFSAAGRERVRRDYHEDGVLNSYRALYESLMQRGASPVAA